MKLVTRSAWGAKPARCFEPVPTIDALVVHYSASGADEQANHANCAGRVRGIQSYHQNTKGWCDVAYNFLFCKHGYIYEGRGWSRKSGATGDDNSHTVAVCFLGDDTAGRDDVTHAGREALGGWLRAASKHYDGRQAVRGHRDYMATACPGNELQSWIRTGDWKTIGLPRVRYELWARMPDKDGKLKPALLTKSPPVPLAKNMSRAKKFHARVASRYVFLLARGRRPNIRRVVV